MLAVTRHFCKKKARDEGHREFSKKMHLAIGIFVQLVVWQVRIKLSPTFSTKTPEQKRSYFCIFNKNP